MDKRILLILSIIALWGIFPVACQKADSPFECTDRIGCVTIAPADPIKLGVIQDLSGGAASFGTVQAKSIELAMVERGNQLRGHPIEFYKQDTGCSAEGGTTAALKIVADPQVVAILGTTCSGAGVTAAGVMSEAGLVMVSGSNIAPSLTAVGRSKGSGWQAGYFRTIYNGAVMGKASAIFAFKELGVTKAATINDGDAYTQELAAGFEQEFAELGGKIVLAAAVNKGDTDMHPVLTAVSVSGAEFVFLPIFPAEGALILKQAGEVTGLGKIVFMGAQSLMLDSFIATIGADGAGKHFIGSALPAGAAVKKLAAKYEARYGEPPDHITYSYMYDAANLLLDTLAAVAEHEEDGTLHIGREALRKALYATSNVEGVTGRLTCNEFGDCSTVSFNVMRLDDPAAGLKGLTKNVIYTYTPDRSAEKKENG